MKDLLQLSGLARSTFYYYLKSQNKDKYENEKKEISNIFNSNKGRYGYRRVLTVLQSRGYSINHKTVLKLMNELKIPQELRDVIPVAADDNGVLWIYGVGVAERAMINKNTKKAIEFITNNK